MANGIPPTKPSFSVFLVWCHSVFISSVCVCFCEIEGCLFLLIQTKETCIREKLPFGKES